MIRLPTNDRYSVLQPILMVIIAIISVQTGASLAKQLFAQLHPAGVATLRLCFASVMLICLFKPWKVTLRPRDILPLCYYGFAMGGMNLLIYLSLQYIPLGIAVALEFIGPLGVAIIMSRKALDFIWITMAILGIALLLPSENTSQLQWQGIIYALGAGLCWGLYIIFGQRAGMIASGGTITTIGMIIAACMIAPVGIASDGIKLLTISIWPIALTIALLSSALPYYLEMCALQRLPAKTFGILMSLEPAVAAISGFIILHEELTVAQLLGLFCIICASTGTATYARKNAITPELQT